MRLKVQLQSIRYSSLTLNYFYPFSAAIYNLLKLSSPEFSTFLHDIGFQSNGRQYKLFTFALKFERIVIQEKNMILFSPETTLIISTPLIDDFIKNFVIGTFEQQFLMVNNTKFNIKFAEILPDISFSETSKFRSMSPLVLSTKRIHNGKEHQHYLRPEEKDEINRVLLINLTNKYNLIYKTNRTFNECELIWDELYLKKKGRVTKKITIDENGTYPIDVIGIQAPFTLKADPDLIKVGYDCGMGEKNSMGCGMVEPI